MPTWISTPDGGGYWQSDDAGGGDPVRLDAIETKNAEQDTAIAAGAGKNAQQDAETASLAADVRLNTDTAIAATNKADAAQAYAEAVEVVMGTIRTDLDTAEGEVDALEAAATETDTEQAVQDAGIAANATGLAAIGLDFSYTTNDLVFTNAAGTSKTFNLNAYRNAALFKGEFGVITGPGPSIPQWPSIRPTMAGEYVRAPAALTIQHVAESDGFAGFDLAAGDELVAKVKRPTIDASGRIDTDDWYVRRAAVADADAIALDTATFDGATPISFTTAHDTVQEALEQTSFALGSIYFNVENINTVVQTLEGDLESLESEHLLEVDRLNSLTDAVGQIAVVDDNGTPSFRDADGGLTALPEGGGTGAFERQFASLPDGEIAELVRIPDGARDKLAAVDIAATRSDGTVSNDRYIITTGLPGSQSSLYRATPYWGRTADGLDVILAARPDPGGVTLHVANETGDAIFVRMTVTPVSGNLVPEASGTGSGTAFVPPVEWPSITTVDGSPLIRNLAFAPVDTVPVRVGGTWDFRAPPVSVWSETATYFAGSPYAGYAMHKGVVYEAQGVGLVQGGVAPDEDDGTNWLPVVPPADVPEAITADLEWGEARRTTTLNHGGSNYAIPWQERAGSPGMVDGIAGSFDGVRLRAGRRYLVMFTVAMGASSGSVGMWKVTAHAEGNNTVLETLVGTLRIPENNASGEDGAAPVMFTVYEPTQDVTLRALNTLSSTGTLYPVNTKLVAAELPSRAFIEQVSAPPGLVYRLITAGTDRAVNVGDLIGMSDVRFDDNVPGATSNDVIRAVNGRGVPAFAIKGRARFVVRSWPTHDLTVDARLRVELRSAADRDNIILRTWDNAMVSKIGRNEFVSEEIDVEAGDAIAIFGTTADGSYWHEIDHTDVRIEYVA